MTGLPEQRATAEPITAVIATRSRALRLGRGMSQADLAAAMTANGIPWSRATVINLEKRGEKTRGKSAGRDSVTVQELLTLARIFAVSPTELLEESSTAATADARALRIGRAVLALVGADPPEHA